MDLARSSTLTCTCNRFISDLDSEPFGHECRTRRAQEKDDGFPGAAPEQLLARLAWLGDLPFPGSLRRSSRLACRCTGSAAASTAVLGEVTDQIVHGVEIDAVDQAAACAPL